MAGSPVRVSVTFEAASLDVLQSRHFKRAAMAALRKAGSTALRDMRSEAVKRIRARKRIASKYISRAISMRKSGAGGDIGSLEWALDISGEPVPLIAYPHRDAAGKRGKRGIGPRSRGGVSVEVNVGKRTIVRSAFVATMRSGHEGIFRRRGPQRLPIDELLGSRPVDALLHRGEADAVAARGGKSLADTYARLLPLELDKVAGK